MHVTNSRPLSHSFDDGASRTSYVREYKQKCQHDNDFTNKEASEQIAHETIRRDVHFSLQEQVRHYQVTHRRRKDPEYRKQEQAKDSQARQRARKDPEYTKQDQVCSW